MPERDSDRRAPLQPLLAAGDGEGRLGRLAFRLGEICRIPVKSRFRQQAWKDLRVMARACDICGKGPQFGNTISHAHNVSKRRWYVNLRPVHAKVGAAITQMLVCTTCLRSGIAVT